MVTGSEALPWTPTLRNKQGQGYGYGRLLWSIAEDVLLSGCCLDEALKRAEVQSRIFSQEDTSKDAGDHYFFLTWLW